MKIVILLASMLFSAPLTAGIFNEYKMLSFPHEEVDSYLQIGNFLTGTPENLQGLWWMDGNPLADEVISFAGAKFDPIVENGELIGYGANIPVFDEGIWTWHDTLAGRFLYSLIQGAQVRYLAVFNPDFTYGEVVPYLQPLKPLPGFEIPSSMLVNFTMTQVDANEWSRDSVLLGQASSYRFRRIVEGDGTRLPAWDEFVAAINSRGPASALMPVCKNNPDKVYPTPCAQ
ncbi:MAG: hypothetical protein ACOH5I_14335 [Oligoflexus sp.]